MHVFIGRYQDFSDTDFILDARDVVAPGDTVPFYVKYVSATEGIVTGSFVPVSRGGGMDRWVGG